MAKFRKEMEAKFQEEVKQKEVKKEIKEEFKKHQDYDRALQEQHEAAEREESAPIDPTQQAEKSRREKSSSNAQSQNANFNSKSNSTPSADDEASKAYLKQLQKWIQENAKSGEQAWQMFWDAFQQQQKSAGNWDDNDQELINHHQTTAYWWFGQAFNETKFDESGTTASQSSTVKKESKKVRVKQEAVVGFGWSISKLAISANLCNFSTCEIFLLFVPTCLVVAFISGCVSQIFFNEISRNSCVSFS